MLANLINFFPKNSGERTTLWCASIVFCTISILLFSPSSQTKLSVEKVGQLHINGKIRSLHRKSSVWTEITREQPAFLHDLIYVPKQSSATLTFSDNRTIQLDPDTLISIDEMTTNHLSITKFEGNVSGNAWIRDEDTFEWRVLALANTP